MKIISESQELSHFSGTVSVDTSVGSVTIFMKPAPKNGSVLKLVKTSTDDNMILLFSDSCKVDGAEITGFGFTPKQGQKLTELTLRSTDKNWSVLKEQ